MLLAACGSNAAESGADASTAATIGTAGTADTAGTSDMAGTSDTSETSETAGTERSGAAVGVDSLAGFDAFADSVKVFTDGPIWLIESNGMPMHQMMVGITSWQQQVPVAQRYTGDNAWQLPVAPVLAEEPVSARTGLFRGAIALAVNGVPIFNALNNRGDDALLAGELDEFGGHCGRADDYHYHVAPLHLQQAVGSGNPIAYALDGFAIYGSTEPDGGPLLDLDEYNGHLGADGIYHYHGTAAYPYINGGLVGVVEASDQVEPQPTTTAIREAGEPLPGATITGFADLGDGSFHLEYEIDGGLGTVDYTVTDTTVDFEFTSVDGVVTSETYQR